MLWHVPLLGRTHGEHFTAIRALTKHIILLFDYVSVSEDGQRIGKVLRIDQSHVAMKW